MAMDYCLHIHKYMLKGSDREISKKEQCTFFKMVAACSLNVSGKVND